MGYTIGSTNAASEWCPKLKSDVISSKFDGQSESTHVYLVIAHVTCWFNIFRSIFKIAFMLLFFHHYHLLASAPLTLVLAHVTLHKSALLAAVLMTALVHCSHILRHVLLQKSTVLAAVPLRCSCDRLWSPFLFFLFIYKQSSRNVSTCASLSTNIDNDNPCTGRKAAPVRGWTPSSRPAWLLRRLRPHTAG